MTRALLLSVALLVRDDAILRADKDVPAPASVDRVAAQYPEMLREVLPKVMGIVVLDLTLNEEGRVTAIKVLRGTPIIDQAAVTAVRRWTYKPTVVEGVARRVGLVEVIEMFPDDRSRAEYFLEMLSKSKEPVPYRLIALERLMSGSVKLGRLQPTLTKISKDDPSELLRTAATEALQTLATKK
jgi:TonB family protein